MRCFALDVNEAPKDITISPMTFPENSPPGAIIGTIRVDDPDFNSTASCRIISGDSQHLAISGLKLVAGSQRVDYEALTSMKYLQVTLRCSDEFNLYIDKSFHISVTGILLNYLAFSQGKLDIIHWFISLNLRKRFSSSMHLINFSIGKLYDRLKHALANVALFVLMSLLDNNLSYEFLVEHVLVESNYHPLFSTKDEREGGHWSHFSTTSTRATHSESGPDCSTGR